MQQLSISLFGSIRISWDGEPAAKLRYQKVQALLAYLADQPAQEHPRSALTGLLWPELPEQTALSNLRQALNHLRQSLSDRRARNPHLLVQRSSIRWNPASPAEIDAASFRALLAAAFQHPHRTALPCPECVQRLEQAVALYQAPFLASFFLPDSAAFEEWAVMRREAYQRQALEAMARLVQFFEQRRDYEQALHYARSQLEIDPWREEIHRLLMRLLVQSGQRSAALAQYESCRQILAVEFGLEPETETKALYEQICSQSSGQLVQSVAVGSSGASSTLPAPVTPFVGRTKELAEIARLFAGPECRLITITGPGGIGKTRLALQAAAEQQASFAGGAHFVPLAGAFSSDILSSMIAQHLGMSISEGDVRQQLLDFLAPQDLLLVLDNFEHLLDGADLVAGILSGCPKVVCLVTSRQRLALYGEWVFDLEGLALPPPGSHENTQDYEAVRLFLQGARRARLSLPLDQNDLGQIVRICQLLDGVPLAVELASAWVRTLSPAEIAQEIEQNLLVLDAVPRPPSEAGKSLQAIFDHSWRLMDAREQAVFSKTAVFRGGFSRPAAQAVAGADLPLLGALLDKSLLVRRANGRYEVHEITRQYALQRLEEAGELAAVRSRHLSYFLELAEAAAPELEGKDAAGRLDQLEAELDNLRAALTWALESADVLSALRLAVALYRFWYWRSQFQEGTYWYEAVFKAAAGKEHTSPGALQGPLPDTLPPDLLARALHASGVLYNEMGALEQAQQRYQESLALRRQTGDALGQAACLNSLGAIAFDRQDYATAETLFEESLALRRLAGQRETLYIPLNNLGTLAQARRDYDRARRLFEESLEIQRELHNQASLAHSLTDLAWVVLAQGDAEYAEALFSESLLIFQEVGDRDGICYCLEGHAGVMAVGAEDLETARRAARCFGAADALRQSIHAPLSLPELAEYQPYLERLRLLLGAEDFERARAGGQSCMDKHPLAENLARLLPGQ